MRVGVLVAVVSCGGSTTTPDSGGSSELTCDVFPRSNGSRDNYAYWNFDISSAPVSPMSDQYLASLGTSSLHPDFGSDPTFGIPFVTVPGSQPKVDIAFDEVDESDPGPYPFPDNTPIEAGGDGHAIVIDRDACVLYETYLTRRSGNTWAASSGARFDLSSGALRSEGFTSADASGGPIFVGLVRYDEVVAGRIDHALRFTARRTQQAYTHPATHFASSDPDPALPPMGLRLRLKAASCGPLLTNAGPGRPQSRTIIQALCTYGMILTDNGSSYFITGATDPRWDDEDLNYIKTIPSSDLEVIEPGPLVTR